LDETNNFLNTFCRPLHGNTEFLLE